MISRKLLLSLILATLLIASSLVVSIPTLRPVSAQQVQAGPIPSGDRAARNWEYINHDSWGQNYSPQNQINKDNVQHLELKWIFPIPAASGYTKNQPGRPPSDGSTAPPLIVDGMVYMTDRMRNTFAFEAATGKRVWTNVYNYDWQAAAKRMPELISAGGDQHANQYVNDIIYTSTNGCNVYTVDAKTGQKKFEIEDICHNVEGNVYNVRADGSDPGYKGIGQYSGTSHPGAVYRKENVYLVPVTGPDLQARGGRSFIDGYDLNQNPPKRVWRTFLQPPGEGDAEWAIKACNNAVGGWYFSYKAWKEQGKLGINCKDVPRENVINDWGVPKHYTSVVTNVWGQMAMDEETGLVYFSTGDQGGMWNTTYTPGPNLYAATTIAMEAKTGKIVWWYQQTVRDMNEGDTAWNNVLAKVPIGGVERKVLIKFSTMGPGWAYDAADGTPLWIFDAPFLNSRRDPDGVWRGRSGCTPNAGGDPSSQDGFWRDIMSKYDMQEKKWFNYPSTARYCWVPIRPYEADIAFDPERKTIYVPLSAGWNSYDIAAPNSGFGISGRRGSVPDVAPKNTTIFALDASTGKEKWSYYINGVAFRGGIITSGGVVIVPAADGYLYFIDADTGKLIHKRFFGTGLVVQPTIGKDAKGSSLLYLMNGRARAQVGALASVDIPGSLMAFGLPDKLPQPQVITKEVIKEVPKEVIKEVPKEVTRTVTVETISPISYAAIGISVVILVIAGVLFTKRKKT